MNFFLDIAIQGLAYSFLAMGISLTFKVLRSADLTVDGSFPLGAVVGAVALANNLPIPLALLFAFVAGSLAGLVTGWLMVKLKIQPLLSGILTMSGLYTINLLIGSNRSNIPVFQFNTIFTQPAWVSSSLSRVYPLFVLVVLVVLTKVAIEWFLKTKRGYMLKVAGDNPQLVVSLGEDLGKYKYLGLSLSNAIIAMGGAIVMMLSRYYDLSMGSGMLVIGLASVVLGDTLLQSKNVQLTTIAIVGSLLYRFSIASALSLNIHPSFLRLLTVIIFVLAIIMKQTSLKAIVKTLGGKTHANTEKYSKVVSSKHS